MTEKNVCNFEGTSGSSTDDGGAVPETKPNGQDDSPQPWYILWVKARTEKSVRDYLIREGFEAFAATRFEIHTWRRSERRKVETVLIPSVVFVRMKKEDRVFVERLTNVSSLMRDPAKRGARSKGGEEYAQVSNDEMLLFQQMLLQEDVPVNFISTDFSVGEYVRIKDFNEDHNIARVVRIIGDRKPYVGLRVSFLGCAYMEIPLSRIAKV